MATFSVQVIAGYVIADGEQVTNAKLRQIAVPTVNVIGTVGTASIADGSITTSKLATGAVTAAKLAANSVTAAAMANGTVTSTQIASSTITGSNVAASTIAAGNVDQTTVAVGVTADSRTLRVAPNVSTPLTKMTATADELVVTGAAGIATKLSAVNQTCDGTVNGAGGLDTGSLANTTWYYLFIIWNPSGPTVSSLLSTSKTSPTMPGGYTYKALVGAVHTDSSAHFDHYIVYGGITKFTSKLQNFVINTAVSIAHNLGALPSGLQWFIQCTSGEAGYATGDTVPVDRIINGSNVTIVTYDAGATQVDFFVLNQTPDLYHKTNGTLTALALTGGTTLTNWQLFCTAWIQ